MASETVESSGSTEPESEASQTGADGLPPTQDKPSDRTPLPTPETPREKPCNETNATPSVSSNLGGGNATSAETIHNVFNQYYAAPQKEGDESSQQTRAMGLLDVSVPLTVCNPPRFIHDRGAVDSWVTTLCEHGILLLVSLDRQSVSSASRRIVKELVDYKPFVLQLENRHGCDVSPLQPAQAGQHGALIIVNVQPGESADFVGRIISTQINVDLVQEALRKNVHLLLIHADPRDLGWVGENGSSWHQREHVPFAQVDFVGLRLRELFSDDWEEVHQELARQRQQGSWQRGEVEFYNEFMSLIGHGKVRFRQEIEMRRQSSPASVLSEPELVSVRALLSPQKSLDNTVLFVATFFSDLLMRDFEILLFALLDNHAAPGEWSSESNLREVWRGSYPEILQRCHLHVRAADTQADGTICKSVIDFSLPGLREDLREAFFGLHSPIFFEHCRRMRESRFLFVATPSLLDAVVRLMVEAALVNPAEVMGQDLGGWLSISLPVVGEEQTVDVSGPILGIRPRYLCLKALLQTPRLRAAATGYLQELFSSQRYEELVRLVWDLRSVADFDLLFWLKRLLDEGPKEARDKASGRLRSAVKGESSVGVLQGVYRWLPAAGPAESRSAEFACRFLIDIVKENLLHGRRGHRATGSLRNPILISAAAGLKENLERLVVSWLFYPAAAASQKGFEEQIGQWIFEWLIPAEIQDCLSQAQLRECFIRLQQQWAAVREDPATVEVGQLDVALLPTLALADWSVELLAQKQRPAWIQDLWERLVTALTEQCPSSILLLAAILWAAVEESILELRVVLEDLDPSPEDPRWKTLAAFREEFQIRQRCVRQLRSDVHARRQHVMYH